MLIMSASAVFVLDLKGKVRSLLILIVAIDNAINNVSFSLT